MKHILDGNEFYDVYEVVDRKVTVGCSHIDTAYW
jgi:hypothetical protein